MDYMKKAIEQANKAYEQEEVPVGAVIVCEDKIVSRAYNKKEATKSAISHAEIIAIDKACRKRKDWRLDDCEMYVTLKPCQMCEGAIIESRIKKVHYCLERNDKAENNYKFYEFDKENSIKYKEILKKFFKDKRK